MRKDRKMIYATDDPTCDYIAGIWCGRRDMLNASIGVDPKRRRMLCIKVIRRNDKSGRSTYVPLNRRRDDAVKFYLSGRIRVRLKPNAPTWMAEEWRKRGALVAA